MLEPFQTPATLERRLSKGPGLDDPLRYVCVAMRRSFAVLCGLLCSGAGGAGSQLGRRCRELDHCQRGAQWHRRHGEPDAGHARQGGVARQGTVARQDSMKI